MTATIYTNTSDPRTVNKSEYLAKISDTTLTLYSSTNLLSPTFKARHKTDGNYLYVEGLGYYYILNQITDSSVCYYVCEKDVLMSNNLSNLPVTVSRNEFDYDMYIADNLLPLKQDKIYYTRNFSPDISVFSNTTEYILGVTTTNEEVTE